MKSVSDNMENITSKSKNFNLKDPVDLYGKFLFRNLGKIIKFIAYLVAIIMLAAGLAGAFLIFKTNSGFKAIAIGVFLIFAVFAFISFFIIYGIGHTIVQNNEILQRLD